jgi:hypothetical protein
LHSDVEVILVGDDAGTAEVCAELGLRHIPEVKKNQHGTKYLASVYDQAEGAARHEILCHVNCDIVLMSDFWRAAQRVAGAWEKFLIAGRRWDVGVDRPLKFDSADWEAELRGLALNTNKQRPAQWIDYFVFRKGLYSGKLPDFFIGRPGWDNWLLWYPLSIGVPVMDASRVVVAVHQNHDYGYHPDGERGVWYGEEAQHNYALSTSRGKHETLESASYVMHDRGFKRNYRGMLASRRTKLVASLYRVWFRALDMTRPLRSALGLRSRADRPTRLRFLVLAIATGLVLWWALVRP